MSDFVITMSMSEQSCGYLRVEKDELSFRDGDCPADKVAAFFKGGMITSPESRRKEVLTTVRTFLGLIGLIT